jgi:hypothetical protein
MNRTASTAAIAFAPSWHSALAWVRAAFERRPQAGTAPAVFVHDVAHRRTLWVDAPLGRRVTCEAGSVWLTFDGQARDVVLQAGEHCECDTDTRLGVYALAGAQVRVQ